MLVVKVLQKVAERGSAIGVLLLVQVWVAHHWASEHHDSHSDHHQHQHESWAGPGQKRIDHNHHNHRPHQARDHELSPVRIKKPIRGECPSVEVIFSRWELVTPLMPPSLPPFSAESPACEWIARALCQPRAPPASFFV